MKHLFALLFSALGIFVVADEQVHQFHGRHVLANYMDCDHAAMVDLDRLKEVMKEAAFATGATVLCSADYIFAPEGISMVLVLSESHASIHTYPEYNACFIDIFTCGEHCDPEKFDKYMQEYLKPAKVNSQTMVRHEEIELTSGT